MNLKTEIRLPRPNLGPEAPPPPSLPTFPWLLLFAAVALLVAVVIRRTLQRRRRTSTLPPPVATVNTAQEIVPSLDLHLRETLCRLFGPSWSALTTEEIAAAPELAARFGEEAAQRLVDYLREVDRSRFSAKALEPDAEAENWVAQFLDFVVSETGTTSMINGK